MLNMIKKLKLPNVAIKFLIFLLLGDLLYIVLHLIHKFARHFDLSIFLSLRFDGAFAVYNELSLGESYQYLKEFWITAIFIWLIWKYKQKHYIGWALLFFYFLLTDMLSLHAELGTLALQAMNVDPFFVLFGEMRYQDFGELGVSLAAGLLIIPIIIFSYFRGNKEVKRIFHYLFGCLLLIVFFGVFNDFANRIFPEDGNKILYESTRLIEDAGEMIAMSISCWYAYTLTEPSPKPAEVS